jgi:hypothetical protein
MVDSESEPERRVSTISPKKSAGSVRQEKVTSRAPPMPSKAEPVSKCRGDGEEASQAEEVGEEHQIAFERDGCARWPPSGDEHAAAKRAVTRPTSGPALNTQVVVRLNTEPLRSSLMTSKVWLQAAAAPRGRQRRLWSCR